LPGGGVGSAGEDGDVMAALLKVESEPLAHLPTAAGDYDAQAAGWCGADLH
jgi:hypothetical protein